MKISIKIIVMILCINIIFQVASAQDEDLEYKGKFFLSPDLGLIFGTTTMIEVSPAFGYYISERLCVATGFIYEYFKQSGNFFMNYETQIYGPRVYARFTLVKNLADVLPVRSNIEILSHIEFESLSLENKYFGLSQNETGRFWFNTALIGGGLSQRSSRRLKFNALILWDVDTSSLSPNSNPIIRIGIQIMLGKIEPVYR